MRIWSLHPRYLDTKGLVALWRETLLAKHVLEGKTKGYTNHPQLTRFKQSENHFLCINLYLEEVYGEALRRGYHFSRDKFTVLGQPVSIPVTQGQLDYETQHLLKKLKTRDPVRYTRLSKETAFDPHPLFCIIPGEIESWEIVHS